MNKKFVGISIVFMLVIGSVTVAATANTSMSSQSGDIKRFDSDVGSPIDLLLFEGFEEGAMPPSGGWETIDYHYSKNWEITTDPVHSGTYAAQVLGMDFANSQDEWLISPELDLTNYDEVTLEFWGYGVDISGAAIELTILREGQDNVIIWKMLGDPDWQELGEHDMEFDLSGFAGDVIKIVWRYKGLGGFDFILDDIYVHGGEIFRPDIEIGKINGKEGTIATGAIVSAEILNVGEGNATDVEWSISATGKAIRFDINLTGVGTVPMIAPDGLEIVRTENEKPFYAIGKVDITVFAREPVFGSSDIKNATGFLLGWKIFFLKEEV